MRTDTIILSPCKCTVYSFDVGYLTLTVTHRTFTFVFKGSLGPEKYFELDIKGSIYELQQDKKNSSSIVNTFFVQMPTVSFKFRENMKTRDDRECGNLFII